MIVSMQHHNDTIQHNYRQISLEANQMKNYFILLLKIVEISILSVALCYKQYNDAFFLSDTTLNVYNYYFDSTINVPYNLSCSSS